MKALDRYLQNVRINKAKKYIRKNDTVLDIGSSNGVLFEKCRGLIRSGIGIDPVLPAPVKTCLYTLLPGYFPDTWPEGMTFDVITMLAVLEHIPPAIQATLEGHCSRLLNKGGRIIITAPSSRVDHILRILIWLRLIDGMSLTEHYGFNPKLTRQIFPEKYYKLISKHRFQFGLNNLFVFEKIN